MMCLQCGDAERAGIDDFCSDCSKKNTRDHAQIINLVEKGHPFHCAYRQVWGDGACECGKL